MDNQAVTTGPATAPNEGSVPQSKPESNVGVLDEFQTELSVFWRQLPNKAFFFTLLAAWLALFHLRGNSILGYIHSSSLFAWMYEAYNTANKAAADDSIGNFIPLVVLGLFWWKRRELVTQPLALWLPGLSLVFLGLALHAAGFVIQEPRVSIVGMFTGIYGSMGLSWGWNWLKNSFFPFFLFIFSIPLGNHSDLITTRLQLLVSWLVEVVCHNILGIDIVREGNQLYDAARTYQYEVAAACSGIRSLFTIFLLATAFGFLTFRSLGKRLFMMSLAVPFAVLGNLIRMMCIVLFATLFGKEWGDKVHENAIASIIPYIPAILGLLWIGGWLERREKRQHPSV